MRRAAIAASVAAALASGCRAPTSLRVTIEHPPALQPTSLTATVTVAGASTTHTLATSAQQIPPSGDLVLLLGDDAADVAVTLSGSDDAGARLVAHGATRTVPHAESRLDLTLARATWAGEILADQPLAWFRLDDPTLTTAADGSGHHNDGTYTGGVTATAGALPSDPDGAVAFDGTSGQVTVGDKLNFTGYASYTLEGWLRPASLTNGYFPRLLSKEVVDANGRSGWLMTFNATDGLTSERWAHETHVQVSVPPSKIPLGAWTHFAATFDGETHTATLYLDGAQAAQAGAQDIALLDEHGPLVLAGCNCPMTNFPGALDEIAIYDRVLPPERLQAHYQAR